MSKISDETRINFKTSDDIRDAGLTTPNDVMRFDDIRYGSLSPLQAPSDPPASTPEPQHDGPFLSYHF